MLLHLHGPEQKRDLLSPFLFPVIRTRKRERRDGEGGKKGGSLFSPHLLSRPLSPSSLSLSLFLSLASRIFRSLCLSLPPARTHARTRVRQKTPRHLTQNHKDPESERERRESPRIELGALLSKERERERKKETSCKGKRMVLFFFVFCPLDKAKGEEVFRCKIDEEFLCAFPGRLLVPRFMTLSLSFSLSPRSTLPFPPPMLLYATEKGSLFPRYMAASPWRSP